MLIPVFRRPGPFGPGFGLPVFLLFICAAARVFAQDATTVIDTASKAMGTSTLQSIQYSGTGSVNPTGQAEITGGPWPRFTVTKYTASLNYSVPAMRQELVRIDDMRPPRGGGAGGFNPATGQGGIRPIPGDIIQNTNVDGRTEVGALNLWLTPHGFLKGAAANAATARVSTIRGKKTVSFTAFNKYTVTGTLDGQDLVERVETKLDISFTGDTLFEGIYSGYKDFGGVKFPSRLVTRQGGFPILDVTVASVTPNSPAAMEIGKGPLPAPAPQAPVRIQAEKIGEGVWFLNFGSPQSALVEFRDYSVIIEGPSSDERTLATLAEAKRLLPNKPVKYLVNTHHHADHSGGIRAYAAEGVPIITHESHKRYYEQVIFKAPHTINPDHLARNPRAPMIETVKDTRVITDGAMTLELHLLKDNPHAEGLLVAYVPSEKMLIQADAFAPRPGAAPLPAPSPYTINLVDNVTRLKLDVQKVAHVHGGVDTYPAVVKVAGR
ncbi:MAG: MBL fold metallo-hydrolase [Acidobacteria bacterium]|nr:MBL fold metallo-hydrolase [Acidobacteriota bacterium]